MRLILLVLIMLISGCSSSPESKNYYQLPLQEPTVQRQPASPAPGSTAQTTHLLWVAQVNLPDFLTAGGLVYQSGEVNYALANHHLWASPLDQQLINSLTNSLNNQLPGWQVSATPLADNQDTLILTISGFHGRYDGTVIVSGEWLLKYQHRVLQQPFYIRLAQQGDGYSAMVQTLAQAWQQEIQQIARTLQQLY